MQRAAALKLEGKREEEYSYLESGLSFGTIEPDEDLAVSNLSLFGVVGSRARASAESIRGIDVERRREGIDGDEPAADGLHSLTFDEKESAARLARGDDLETRVSRLLHVSVVKVVTHASGGSFKRRKEEGGEGGGERVE